MRKRTAALVVVFAMLLTLTSGAWSQNVWGAAVLTAKQFMQTLPSYERLDKDLINDAAVQGEKVTGKTLRGFNGNAYVKPGNYDNLKPLDMRGQKKGIAILVDFPVENTQGNISDVPGVKYPQIPVSQFMGVLDGKIYNPYELPIFSWIKEEALKMGFTPATDRTLNNYYAENSYGQFSIDVDVKGWYTLPHNYDYYLGQNKGYYNENGDAYISELVMDAIRLADADGVNFADYATAAKEGDFGDLYGSSTSFVDESGNVVNQIVPNIFIIHRGTGAEYSRDPNVIWSHKWDILSANYYGQYYQTGSYPADSSLKYEVVDGVVVNTYNICPEVGQDITGYRYKDANGNPIRKPSPVDPGVFAHEFGHVLGVPDQYDYGYDSEGTGMFSIMASGSYGRDVNTSNALLNRYFSGFSPVHMDAWSKYYLGFLTPKEIKPEDGRKTVTLRPLAKYQDVYKVVVPGSNGKEYFLLENRQQVGYDKGIAYTYDGANLHGLVVYHIDENVLVRNFHRPNEAANWDWNNRGKNYHDPSTGENHYGIAVVQADGRWDMEKDTYITGWGYDDGDSSDPYPGTAKVTKLSPDINANPNTLSYYIWGTDNRSYTGITIENIKEKNGVITADVYFAQ